MIYQRLVQLIWPAWLIFFFSLFALAQGKTAKAPVRSEADEAKASQLIKEVYHSNDANADSLGAKQVWRRNYSKRPGNCRTISSPSMFSLESPETFHQGLDGLTAFYAIDNLAETFYVDAIEMKLCGIEESAEAARTRKHHLP